MRVVKIAILVLAVGPFVQACVIPVGVCSRTEAPEFSATAERTTRNDVVAVLGEPLETIKSEDGRVDIYEYDGSCAGLEFVLGVPIPFVRMTDHVVTVEYRPDGSFLTVQFWPDAKTPQVVIEYETERLLKVADVKKRARAGDSEAMWEYAHVLTDSKESWKWFCLAANQGLSKAQYHLGNYFRRGSYPVSRDVIRAYLWYSLAGAIPDRFKIDGITPAQIVEATRLIAEWQPNSAECDV